MVRVEERRKTSGGICRRGKTKAGFTLIELLIAVAIVGILAAIAVPNFLEAQTRAKVSRAWSDMRTVGAGLETYHIDHTGYPPDYSAVGRDPLLRSFLPRLARLTTPIAYCSSVPEDPFAKPIAGTGSPCASAYRIPFETGPLVRPFPYDYATRDPDAPNDTPETWAKISRRLGQVQWALRSVGPSLRAAWLGDGAPAYDPTNGTASLGNLYFTGPGIGIDGPSLGS